MSRHRRVLFIGSPEVNVADFLIDRGYTVRTTSLDDAHAQVIRWRPQIVIVDPTTLVDAASFVDSIRWSPAVLVVALTDRPQEPEHYVTFDVWLVRPVDPFELHSILSAWPARTKSTNAPPAR